MDDILIALLPYQHANALRSVDYESYTDSDFVGYKISKVALVIENSDFEIRKQITKQLSKTLSTKGVEIISNKELFPPTRAWTNESR